MAMQEGSPAHTPSAQVVGNAFVEQYYHILHQSPNLVHRFYQDSSHLSRPDMYGNMTTVTTMQAINEKVLSLNYEDYTAEIKTADAQDSFEKGVIVLVTGCLTGKDNVRKKFTQTFFLAPQEKGYFILNDVFRYVEEKELQNSVPVNGISEQASTPALTPEPEPIDDHLAQDPLTYSEEEDINNGAEVCDPSDKEEGSVVEEEVVEPQNIAGQNESVVAADSAPVVPEGAPKKSYASIVKVMKSYVRTNNVRAAPADQQSIVSAKPAPAPEAAVPYSDNAPESSNDNEEAEGHSIYVRNLPHNATPQHLEEAFKKFGPIKHNGSKSEVISRDSLLVLLNLRLQVQCRVHLRLHQSQLGIVKQLWKKKGQILELVAMGDQGILQVKVVFGVTVSGLEGTLAVAGEAMAGMNSETRVSFQDDLRVQVDGMEIIIRGDKQNRLSKMEGVAVGRAKA